MLSLPTPVCLWQGWSGVYVSNLESHGCFYHLLRSFVECLLSPNCLLVSVSSLILKCVALEVSYPCWSSHTVAFIFLSCLIAHHSPGRHHRVCPIKKLIVPKRLSNKGVCARPWMCSVEDWLLFVSLAVLRLTKLASRMESPLYGQHSASPSRAVSGMTFSLRGGKMWESAVVPNLESISGHLWSTFITVLRCCSVAKT